MKIKSNELLPRLKNGEMPPAILLYGLEQGLIGNHVEALRKQTLLDDGAADFDAETFFGQDLNQERFFSACQSFPFLSKKKFILLKEADKTLPEARKNLLAYLSAPVKTTLLVLQADNMEASHAIRKGFESSKSAWAIPFFPLEGGELSRWIRDYLKKNGYQVDPDALQHLSQRLGGNSQSAASELDKLQLFLGDNRTVGLDEVLAVVGETVQYSSFGLASALFNGQTQETLTILDKLLETGEAPLAMLGTIAMRLRRIIQGQALLKQGENPKIVSKKLRIFWREEREFLNHCHSINPKSLANSLLDCQEADKALKGGGGTPQRVMSGLVMRMSGRFRGRRGFSS
ncbi:MAG: DNA polymerase III subunit delta [Magnetococcales bacterium]|nr:DNA polymerase III subunit delta [Magnetococcales bacterium]